MGGRQPPPGGLLSLDQADSDPTRFLVYLVAALRTMFASVGDALLHGLQSPQPPPAESILTALLNEIAAIPDSFVLVLDDYHVIDSRAVDATATFLLEHLPPRMRLVITTYNTHLAHPYEWKKGVRFYKRLKDKLIAHSELHLAA
jgi:LuxR family maltose regulon positive regulatory protein